MKARRLVAAVIVLLVLLGLAAVYAAGSTGGRAAPGRALARPPFLAGVAAADADTSAIGQKLDAEAGISAYVQTGPIDLTLIRGQFRTIELDTADYIVGSVPVDGYYEHYDPHVYVHRSGWILAYYLKTDPAAKIIDQHAKKIDTDKLKTVVGKLAALAGTSAEGIAYYDFRYPNANRILIVAEDSANGNDFRLQLPLSYSYNELSFATDYNGIYVDNVYVNYVYGANYAHYGTLTLAQLTPGVTHAIRLNSGFGAIVIVHRVP